MATALCVGVIHVNKEEGLLIYSMPCIYHMKCEHFPLSLVASIESLRWMDYMLLYAMQLPHEVWTLSPLTCGIHWESEMNGLYAIICHAVTTWSVNTFPSHLWHPLRVWDEWIICYYMPCRYHMKCEHFPLSLVASIESLRWMDYMLLCAMHVVYIPTSSSI